MYVHGRSPRHKLIFIVVLAVQNMGASGKIEKDQEIEFNALVGSLSMMSKVLNDVLDLCAPSLVTFTSFQLYYFSNRMDSGNFELMSRVCFRIPLWKAIDAHR